jgi:hypothetical protein
MKTTYKGIINGKPTEITFEGENHEKKLTNFCTRYQADSSKFIVTKQTKKADEHNRKN